MVVYICEGTMAAHIVGAEQSPREPTPSVALNIGITHTSTTLYTKIDKYKQIYAYICRYI